MRGHGLYSSEPSELPNTSHQPTSSTLSAAIRTFAPRSCEVRLGSWLPVDLSRTKVRKGSDRDHRCVHRKTSGVGASRPSTNAKVCRGDLQRLLIWREQDHLWTSVHRIGQLGPAAGCMQVARAIFVGGCQLIASFGWRPDRFTRSPSRGRRSSAGARQTLQRGLANGIDHRCCIRVFRSPRSQG